MWLASGFLLFLSPLAIHELPQDETGLQDETKGRRVVGSVIEGKRGATQVVVDETPIRIGEPDAKGLTTIGREGRREKLRQLAQRISGAEEVLLYDATPERKAIEYNALQREKTRDMQRQLRGLQEEQLEFLKGLSATYRAEQGRVGKTKAREWLERNKVSILRGIRRHGDYGRRVKSSERSLEELDRSDERLRRLIAWKRSEKEAAKQRGDAVVTDTPVLEVPDVPDVNEEASMSKEELELFEKLFPSDR
ncbi:MAG: hypothetical protein H6834_16535 [Planctomycetes bacterium]|nr:hypothetical protein [Planctomycetota bacterium]